MCDGVCVSDDPMQRNGLELNLRRETISQVVVRRVVAVLTHRRRSSFGVSFVPIGRAGLVGFVTHFSLLVVPSVLLRHSWVDPSVYHRNPSFSSLTHLRCIVLARRSRTTATMKRTTAKISLVYIVIRYSSSKKS